ncbi:MAG TPA: CsbD family protein [Usitatibacter sp.]|nr:CsbD family protein [Usitatibacter sp.]
MNRDQVKGRMKDAGGKMQQKAGKASGSIKHQAKGLAKQASGKLQRNAGDARNAEEKGRY